MRLIFRFNYLWEVLVDYKQFFNKTFRNNVFFANFDKFCRFSYNGRSRTAYNFIRFEKLNNRIRFFGKVLVAFVYDNLKRNTIIKSLVYPL